MSTLAISSLSVGPLQANGLLVGFAAKRRPAEFFCNAPANVTEFSQLGC